MDDQKNTGIKKKFVYNGVIYPESPSKCPPSTAVQC